MAINASRCVFFRFFVKNFIMYTTMVSYYRAITTNTQLLENTWFCVTFTTGFFYIKFIG